SPTLDNLNSENEIKKFFFETNHLIRWKKNLNDYRDLNTRYVKLADIISFKDNNLTLDLFAKVYFKLAFLGLDEKSAFNNELLSGENLYKFIELKDLLVNPPKITEVLARLKTDYGIELKNRAEVQEYFEDERIKKFNALIDEKFTIENIIDF
ncbi:AlwI family type II restriction endonuclease, partial [Brevibacillus sp. MER 51]|uniref:AlwI family type II restriction endonuclease n=1 Tax=Brevibacillus sp. MER 51 TaxID=2939560 RepID=UPI00203B8F97